MSVEIKACKDIEAYVEETRINKLASVPFKLGEYARGFATALRDMDLYDGGVVASIDKDTNGAFLNNIAYTLCHLAYSDEVSFNREQVVTTCIHKTLQRIGITDVSRYATEGTPKESVFANLVQTINFCKGEILKYMKELRANASQAMKTKKSIIIGLMEDGETLGTPGGCPFGEGLLKSLGETCNVLSDIAFAIYENMQYERDLASHMEAIKNRVGRYVEWLILKELEWDKGACVNLLSNMKLTEDKVKEVIRICREDKTPFHLLEEEMTKRTLATTHASYAGYSNPTRGIQVKHRTRFKDLAYNIKLMLCIRIAKVLFSENGGELTFTLADNVTWQEYTFKDVIYAGYTCMKVWSASDNVFLKIEFADGECTAYGDKSFGVRLV